MKKIIALILTTVLTLTMFTACGTGSSQQGDSDEITMFIGLGNNQQYYEKLQKAIKDELGYDVKFIYKRAEDTTNVINQQFKNNDLCADIICTGSAATSDEWVENSCINYLTASDITSKFSYSKVKECTCDDGGVYQLPFTSRLIGITYNKTLMEEQGWEAPSTFDEMVALKEKCDAQDIQFAVCGDFATGHGFNWLFHTMGSQWLTTFEGTEWIEGFLEGTESIDAFKKEGEYYKKYFEAGLFGDVYTKEWDASAEFSKKRALFLYDLTNSVYSYDGPQYDADGKKIKGTKLHDEYASMPWISEDGKNNSFTNYDNMFIALNKNLQDNQDKLDKVLETLEYMTTEEVTSIFTDAYQDGYIAVAGYEPQENALYSEFNDRIKKGYLQPWYYSYFDPDTVVKTGEVINNYMNNKGATYDDIMATLDASNKDNVNKDNPVLGKVEKTLGYEELAEFEAMCGARSLQKKLDDAGENAEVQVALMPYIENDEDMPLWTDLSAINTKLYKGDFEEVYLNTVLIQSAKSPQAVYMKGSDIKELVDKGYEGKYPIALITKGNIEIKDGKTYLTAVNYSTFPEGQYDKYLKTGKVLQPGDTETLESPGEGLVPDGIRDYFEEYGSINPDKMEWK